MNGNEDEIGATSAKHSGSEEHDNLIRRCHNDRLPMRLRVAAIRDIWLSAQTSDEQKQELRQVVTSLLTHPLLNQGGMTGKDSARLCAFALKYELVPIEFFIELHSSFCDSSGRTMTSNPVRKVLQRALQPAYRQALDVERKLMLMRAFRHTTSFLKDQLEHAEDPRVIIAASRYLGEYYARRLLLRERK